MTRKTSKTYIRATPAISEGDPDAGVMSYGFSDSVSKSFHGDVHRIRRMGERLVVKAEIETQQSLRNLIEALHGELERWTPLKP